MDTPKPLVYIGIDIAKLTFDACLVKSPGKSQKKSLPNTPEGFAKLLRWLAYAAPEAIYHFCMEATGSYYEALAIFLAEAGHRVSVVNPHRTHHAAKASGAGNKTDPVEAHALAEYCRKENPPLWRRATPEVRTLLAVLRRLHALKEHLVQEQNRFGDPGVNGQPEVLASLKKSIAFLQEEIAALLQQIKEHIDRHPTLKVDRDLLLSIPGIGEVTAAWILAELPDVKLIASAQSAAAYSGLAPYEYRSGTSVRRETHLSKRGNVHLRRALYMPAMAAVRFNPAVKAIYDRLIERGRPRMVALGAAMRKLLMLAYGVLKNQKSFDADWLTTRPDPAEA
jgi:transposase